MENPIVVERTFNTSAAKVWAAITDKNEMKAWYFDLAEFKPEVGFRFEFMGGPEDGVQYRHICEVTEVIPGKKLTYSWRYDGYPGISFVSWELIEAGDKTTLKLTHTGLESFPQDKPDFAKHNFEEGWNHIINISLKEYLDK